MKKVLITLLCLFTVFSNSISIRSIGWIVEYHDVNKKDWYYDCVISATQEGLMKSTGKGNSYFEPNKTITRGMVATILYRMDGQPSVSFRNRFKDVKKGLWYSNAITWASNKSIVNGYKNGDFGPDNAITRQDLAVMFKNYANYMKLDMSNNVNLNKYIDASKVDSYAKDAMKWCVSKGIISGSKKANGIYLNPKQKATRAECAKMIMSLKALWKNKFINLANEVLTCPIGYNNKTYISNLDKFHICINIAAKRKLLTSTNNPNYIIQGSSIKRTDMNNIMNEFFGHDYSDSMVSGNPEVIASYSNAIDFHYSDGVLGTYKAIFQYVNGSGSQYVVVDGFGYDHTGNLVSYITLTFKRKEGSKHGFVVSDIYVEED